MELFKIFGTIALNGKDKFNEDIDDASDRGSRLGEKLGKVASTVGKATLATIGAAATGVGILTKNALDEYSNYEQLVGGIQTLFGETSIATSKLLDYADIAYRRQGLSANEYMETVMSMSASLVQSLGGDVDRAADMANMAITDMADNANKMGSSMESIQNAYAGFAKQNYTMLDNLKIGYGGTASEMQRLIMDAEKLDATFTASRDTNGDLTMSYDEIVQAIHIVQTNMGITGTTAKEAAETISGSVSAMKASWKNLMTGLADDNANISVLISRFVGSAETAFGNIIPRIQQILLGIGEAIEQLAPAIGSALPKLVNSIIPSLVKAGIQMVKSIITGILSAKEEVFASAFEVVGILVEGFGELLPLLLDFSTELITSFCNAISANPEAFVTAIIQIITTITNAILDNLPLIITAVALVVANVLAELIRRIPELLAVIGQILMKAGQAILTSGEAIFDALDIVILQVVESVKQLWSRIQEIWSVVSGWFSNNIIEPLKQHFINLWTSIQNTFNGIVTYFKGMWAKMKSTFTSLGTSIGEAVGGAVKGAVNGIIGWIESTVNKAVDMINGVLDVIRAIPGAGGIGSVSRLSLPRLAKGGVLEKGQVGLLEGDGAEAVVPLDQNRKWISAVADDMNATGFNASEQKLDRIAVLIEELIEMMPDTMVDAYAKMKFQINNREFARLVKVVE